MGKGQPPNRRDCRFDHLVVAAINKGLGTELRYTGVDSYERADDVRKGIYRCARHRGLTADAGHSRPAVNDEMGIWKDPGGKTWQVRYRIWDKRAGRKHHIERRGSDRSQWPYDPRQRMNAEEKAQRAPRDEQGNVVSH